MRINKSLLTLTIVKNVLNFFVCFSLGFFSFFF